MYLYRNWRINQSRTNATAVGQYRRSRVEYGDNVCGFLPKQKKSPFPFAYNDMASQENPVLYTFRYLRFGSCVPSGVD